MKTALLVGPNLATPAYDWAAQQALDALSPSLQDGFHGAGDAHKLAWYAEHLTDEADLAKGLVHVQCNEGTREMLERAGLRDCVTHDSYVVRVVKDRFNRWQLAPVEVADQNGQNGQNGQGAAEVVSAYHDAGGWVLFDIRGNPVEPWPSGWPEQISRKWLKERGIEVAA